MSLGDLDAALASWTQRRLLDIIRIYVSTPANGTGMNSSRDRAIWCAIVGESRRLQARQLVNGFTSSIGRCLKVVALNTHNPGLNPTVTRTCQMILCLPILNQASTGRKAHSRHQGA